MPLIPFLSQCIMSARSNWIITEWSYSCYSPKNNSAWKCNSHIILKAHCERKTFHKRLRSICKMANSLKSSINYIDVRLSNSFANLWIAKPSLLTSFIRQVARPESFPQSSQVFCSSYCTAWKMSHVMRKPFYAICIHAVWSAPLLFAA